MLEENIGGMEKKGTPRQSSSTLSKSNGGFERKNEPISASKYHGRNSKKRESTNGRGVQPDFFNRRPIPQKNRSALDKRPRQRGSDGYRQREEVAEAEGGEANSSFLPQGCSKKVNYNHLLNFNYAPRENVVGSSGQPRARRRPRVPFNKELYLQANCQFVVKDSGNYTEQAKNPDSLVDWDLVEQVRTFSHEEPTCPICLQQPLAGKITKCGHIYCCACILHYLSLDDKSWRMCPICYEAIHISDLRSVKVQQKKEQKVGDLIILQLMKRKRDSTYTVPLSHWEDGARCPQNINDEKNTEFAKVLVASAQQIKTSVIEEERRELEFHLGCAEPSEVQFIEAALSNLQVRETELRNRAHAARKDSGESKKQAESCTVSNPVSTKQDENGNNGRRPNVSTPLHKSMSFDNAKIHKKYPEAALLYDLDDTEEESVVSEDQSDNDDDQESLDSLASLSSPVSDSFLSQPLPLPTCQSLSSLDELQNLSEDTCSILPPELAAEATMTAEEAVEQLALPPVFKIGHDSPREHRPKRDRNVAKQEFYFYQASDGQHIYLHSVNARCIIHQYGSLEQGPRTITAKIVDKEITFMTEDIRHRLPYLRHLPKTCEFQVVEVKLEPPVVSQDTLQHFSDELKQRALKRQRMRREDRRKARKQNIEDLKVYGIYPAAQLSLDSTDHFPAPSFDLEERGRQSSFSDTASVASPPKSSFELDVNAAEFTPKPCVSKVTQENAPISFAAKLKQPAPAPVTPSMKEHGSAQPAATAAAGPLPARRIDTDESDNEDRVPVPLFQKSFIADVSVVLEPSNVNKNAGGQEAGKGGKKKKKKETKLLFSTSMIRRT